MSRRSLSLITALLLSVFGYSAADAGSLDEVDAAILANEYSRALDLIEKGLDAAPGDPALRMRRARVQSHVGSHDAALDIVNALREEYPNDVDYSLARAQILGRQGRDDDALDELHQALILAPDYEELRQLQHSILSRQQKVADPSPSWTLLVGAGYEELSNGSPSWNRQFVEVSRENGPASRYRFGVSRDERFDDTDLTVLLGGHITIDPEWSAGLDLTFASRPDFLATLSYSAHVSRSLPEGWAINLKYRRREYESVTVGSVAATIEKYISDFRFAYTHQISHLHGASNARNHGFTMNWYYDDRSSLGLALNTGDEAEVIGPGRVLETNVRGMTLSGRRQLTTRFGLHWWLGLHDQGDFYRREYLGLAVSIQL